MLGGSMTTRKGAIIGYGFIAERGHLPAYEASGNLEVVAVADTCAARRDAAAKALPKARIYDDYRSLLAAEASKIDFVDISTPPYVHAEIALAALDAGLHVLCEKPLATRVEDARAILKKAERVKRVIMPSHNYKHAPVIKAVRKALDDGLIGKVHLVTLDTFRNTHARGVSEWRESWRREEKYSGGGIAMDHGAHTFYLAFDWLRSYPTAITAKMSTLGKADTEDTFSTTITFPTGTAIANLTWTAGIRKVIYTLHGDRGAIRVEDDDVEVAVMHYPNAAVSNGEGSNGDGSNGGVANGKGAKWTVEKEAVHSDWMDASHVTWFASLFERFVDAIDTNEYVGKDARDAYRCVELITTAYASAHAGCREMSLETPPARELRLVAQP
jgi:predicted dehydrogenase